MTFARVNLSLQTETETFSSLWSQFSASIIHKKKRGQRRTILERYSVLRDENYFFKRKRGKKRAISRTDSCPNFSLFTLLILLHPKSSSLSIPFERNFCSSNKRSFRLCSPRFEKEKKKRRESRGKCFFFDRGKYFP